MTFMSKTYGSKLNRWVMKPEQWFEYNQWYSCEDYWETNEQCDSSLIRSSGGWSCQSVNIHIRRTLQLDDDFIIYELPVANCQDHPISSSIIQCLPVANNMYIYIHIHYIHIYIYTQCMYIYIYAHLPLTIDIPIANQVHQLQWSNLRRQDASSLSKVVEVAPGVCRGNSGGVSTSYKDQLVRILYGV